MRNFVDLVVVIPIGPKCKEAFICDTIDSVQHYVHSDYRIILSDDSQKGTGQLVQGKYPEVEIVKTRHSYGKQSGLYISLSNAYRYALANYEFRALLRLDTDALVIGDNPEAEAIVLFEENPKMGLAGRYISGNYSADDMGNNWNNLWIRMLLVNKVLTWRFFTQPIINYKLKQVIIGALSHGYELGENIFGGAYFFSQAGLEALDKLGLLPLKLFRNLGLEEDHLFSLLIKYAGLELGDLASGDLPFGCSWVGLPASPEELYAKNKKVIHSTRSWAHMKEEEIRHFFRSRREEVLAESYG